ncbi:MAG: fasciclin domain-containing protein [Nitriliruptor sp.]
MRSTRRSLRIAAAAASAALLLAACGGDDTETATDTGTETEATDDTTAEDDMAEDDMSEDMGDDAAAEDDTSADLTQTNLGEACAAIPADGDGSAEGMADDPVATAASNNPLLSTLVSLVDQAGLVDTLNGLEGATVFAPTNDAFDALQESDPELFDTVANDPDLLATVLTYHVVGDEELNAQDLLDAGTATTVAEQDVTIVEGGAEGIQLEAAGGNTADVICGNVETANATVHLIDAVLLPDVG